MLLIDVYFVFSFLYFFDITKSGFIIENPLEISNNKYPIVFNSNIDSFNIITSGQMFIINKTTSEIKNIITIEEYTTPFFLSYFKENNYYLFGGNNFYTLTLDTNLEVQKLDNNGKLDPNINLANILSSSPDCIGYIKEKEFSYTYYNNKKGVKSQIKKDEIIFYFKNENNIYFYYIEENLNYSFSIGIIDNHIFCKLVDSAKYVCSFIINNIVKIGVIIYKYKVDSYSSKEISCNSLTNITRFSNHDIAVLIDLSETNNKKILCTRSKISNLIECCFIEIQINYYIQGNLVVYYSSIEINNINKYYGSLSFKMDKCYFIGFFAEYLLCCGEENVINCYRMNQTFHYINHFQIEMVGNNNYLTIINNNAYASLFYINENTDKTIIYEHFIYPPKCHEITKEIIIFIELKININDLFDRKDNIKYNIKFEKLPINYGTVKLNETRIETDIYDIDINNNIIFFSFIPDNTTIEIISFIFNISIKETYSETCNINFIIKFSSDSCMNCSKSKANSTNEEHNCINCKDNFFPFSQKKQIVTIKMKQKIIGILMK